MGEKLNAIVQRQDGALQIKLAGVIDEDNHLAELSAKVPIGRALIDLGDVERINSCGTRDWVNWIAELESRGVQPVLAECSPAIVAQLNLVRNFSGGAIVKSFYVPYHCPQCNKEKVLLVDVADLGAPPYEPPICRCDECDGVMTFDDMPDQYFAFLSQKHRTSAEQLDKEVARGSSPVIKPRARTSKSGIVSRHSAPLLPPLRPASQPRIEAVPSLASRQSRPVLGTGTTPPPMESKSAPSQPPPSPEAGLSPTVKLLIIALTVAIAALAVLVATT